MKYFLLLIIFISTASNFAQTIHVVSKQTNEPIEDVFIYATLKKTISVITDRNGKANIKAFQEPSKKDTTLKMFFQHPSFNTASYSFTELKNNQYLVSLEEKTTTLKELVFSANKWEQDVYHIPNQIVGISTKDISFQNNQTSADLLNNTGQVFVQKSQLGGGSPMLRGFSANSILLVLDGVRLNNAIYRSGNLQNVISMDANSMEGVEVIFGPGSVIYGSDALGGVMDFHTITPLLNGDKASFSGNYFFRYSSANKEKTEHVDFSIKGKKLSLLSSISYSEFSDLKSGANFPSDHPDFGKRLTYVERINGVDVVKNNDDPTIQKFTGYDQLNLMQKVRFKPTEHSNFIYSFHYATSSNIPRYDRLTQPKGDNLKFAEWYYGPQKWLMNSLKYENDKKSALSDKFKLTLAFQKISESRNNRKLNNDWLTKREEEVKVFSVNFDAFKIFEEGKKEVFYGFELVSNDVSSNAHSRNISTGEMDIAQTRYPDGGSKYQTAAFYATYKWILSDKFTITTGARFNQVYVEANFKDESFFDLPFEQFKLNRSAINGSFGLVFHPQKSTQINFNAASGFRSPNVDDIGKIFDVNESVVVPNNNIRPEKAYNFELGLQQNFSNKFKIGITSYYTILTDAIVRREYILNGIDSLVYEGDLLNVQALTNTNRAEIYGVSIQFGAKIGRFFNTEATFNFTDGKDVTEDKPLRHTPPNFGKVSLTFEKNKVKANINVQYSGKKEFDDLAPSEQDKTYLYSENGSLAWWTAAIKASYQIHSKISLQAGVDNLFDLHYRPYSSGISAPGRNFTLALRGNF